jgi:hypothetical protein
MCDVLQALKPGVLACEHRVRPEQCVGAAHQCRLLTVHSHGVRREGYTARVQAYKADWVPADQFTSLERAENLMAEGEHLMDTSNSGSAANKYEAALQLLDEGAPQCDLLRTNSTFCHAHDYECASSNCLAHSARTDLVPSKPAITYPQRRNEHCKLAVCRRCGPQPSLVGPAAVLPAEACTLQTEPGASRGVHPTLHSYAVRCQLAGCRPTLCVQRLPVACRGDLQTARALYNLLCCRV